jgi:4-amino-4-deoxy-L-arabinose transferase-like glycosyltransferase
MPSEPRKARVAAGGTRWRTAAIGVVAGLVYLPALASGFNADDYLILWRIKSIAGLDAPLGYFQFAFYEYFRPLTFLSHALDWRIWGPNPAGFHLTNLLLHAANAMLVYRLAHRLFPGSAALVAGLFFAVHPSAHEVVYWIAARFDLLATFFVLVALACLTRRGAAWFAAGLATFAMALLAKESAISLLIIVPAWDNFIDKRSLRETFSRLLPLLVVVAVYAAVRTLGADLAAAGGERRLPKVMMTALAVAGLMFEAWRRERPSVVARAVPPPFRRPATVVLLAGLLCASGLLLWSATFPWTAEKLGFLTHVLFYSLSPIILPAPDPAWFMPASVGAGFLHLAAVAAAGGIWLWLWRRVGRRSRDMLLFVGVLVLATLLPVSSMTGGLRYLYLPAVGFSLVVTNALLVVSERRRAFALALLAMALMLSVQQLLYAGRAWLTASTMTREGIGLMSTSVERCREDDILLLTTPVGIGDVYANFSWDAFDVETDCPPRTFMTLLRVVRTEAVVTLIRSASDVVEFSVPGYTGNIVASSDLRHFEIHILPGDRRAIETPAGKLDTWADGTTQSFRLTLSGTARSAKRFYYSAGRIRQ